MAGPAHFQGVDVPASLQAASCARFAAAAALRRPIEQLQTAVNRKVAGSPEARVELERLEAAQRLLCQPLPDLVDRRKSRAEREAERAAESIGITSSSAFYVPEDYLPQA